MNQARPLTIEICFSPRQFAFWRRNARSAPDLHPRIRRFAGRALLFTQLIGDLLGLRLAPLYRSVLVQNADSIFSKTQQHHPLTGECMTQDCRTLL